MTEIDAEARGESAGELDVLRVLRDQAARDIENAQAQFAQIREEIVQAVRRGHDHGMTDQQMADTLRVDRKTVNQLRLHGRVRSGRSGYVSRQGETPALNSVGVGQGNPVKPRNAGASD